MRTIWAISREMLMELIRKKDFYVLLILMLVLLGFLSSQSFFQVQGVERYIRDFGYSLVMFFSFLIAVIFCAKQLPAEIESRTIYPLLAKPLSRFKLILGKYTGGVMVSAIAFTLFYSVYAAFYILGGGGRNFVLLFQGYIFGVMFLCMVAALVIFLSNFLTMSANVALSALLYVVINGFSTVLRDGALMYKGPVSVLYGIMYYLVPHLEFYDLRIRIAHGWDPVIAWVVWAVIVYTFVYCFFLLYFAGLIFKRKRL